MTESIPIMNKLAMIKYPTLDNDLFFNSSPASINLYAILIVKSNWIIIIKTATKIIVIPVLIIQI